MTAGLTPEQAAAVEAGPGPVRVLAGAGTGKTAVIVEKFLRLVRQGEDPAAILVMTFTERAAGEMRQRIQDRVPGEPDLSVGTFHALAQRWLRDEWRAAGVPAGFGILSGAERWILAWQLLWELGDAALCEVEHPEHRLTSVLRLLERLKQELIPLARLEAWVRRAEASEQRDLLAAAARLFRAYARACRERRLLDFDDLLGGAVRMLGRAEDVLARYRARYPWVLVDEYQDTNLAQERIVELLGGDSGRVFVVGDDDQSIYRFRGASKASLERFAGIFPELQTLTLTRNRRSTPPIVAAATALVEHNPDRVPKMLRPTRRGATPVEVWRSPDAASEALAIAAEVRRLNASGLPLAGIAVLTRTNAIAAPLARQLRAAGLPCRTSDWWGFFERPGCKDVVAALRLARSAGDQVAAERLRRGFGALRARAWEGLRESLAVQSLHLGIADLYFELMERSEYLEGDPDLRSDAIRFGDFIAAFCERAPDQSLPAFLEHLRLVQLSGLEADLAENDPEPAPPPDAVHVMTIHQAKGLEFEAVFVPAMVEGRLPQPPRREGFELPPAVIEPAMRGREDHTAEERRLCYVAMTRARTHLYLSWAERYEGERRWRPSPFLAEIAASAGEHVVHLELPAVVQAAPPTRKAPAASAEPATFSFSSLSTYRECPRQHFYRYRRRLPVPSTPEGFLGDAVHRTLMGAGERRAAGRCLGAAEVTELLDLAWAEQPFPEPRQEAVFRRLAGELVRGYLADGGLAAAPLHVERSFEIELDGFTLRGVIDRVDQPAEPGAPHVLIDYKTGAALPAARLRRDFQLSLYALAARRSLGLQDIELEIAYLRDRKRVRVTASDELLEAAESTAREAVAAIRAGDFEPKPERRRCRACAFRLACDAAM